MERIKKTKVMHGTGSCYKDDEPINVSLGYKPSFILLMGYRTTTSSSNFVMNIYDSGMASDNSDRIMLTYGNIGSSLTTQVVSGETYMTLNEDGFIIEPGIGDYEYYTEK